MVFVDKNFKKLKIFLTLYLFPKLQDNIYKYIFIYYVENIIQNSEEIL